MKNFISACKYANKAFKACLDKERENAKSKAKFDLILNAISIVPETVDITDLKNYLRREIACYEAITNDIYERKDELNRIGQPIPTSEVTVEFDDDGSITVAEEYHE